MTILKYQEATTNEKTNFIHVAFRVHVGSVFARNIPVSQKCSYQKVRPCLYTKCQWWWLDRRWDTTSTNLLVGIGTTAPAYSLDINGAINVNDYYLNTYLVIEDGADHIIFGNTGFYNTAAYGLGGTYYGVNIDGADYLHLMVGSSEYMRIIANGNVGIATTESTICRQCRIY